MTSKHPPLSSKDRARLLRRVDFTLGCWIWTGTTDDDGYGKFTRRVDGKAVTQFVHRLVYEMLHEINPDDGLDHLCRTPGCCNPGHLEPVSNGENLRRSPLVGRWRPTHCKWGHEFTPENTTIRPNGSRMCRTCQRRRCRENYERKKEVR